MDKYGIKSSTFWVGISSFARSGKDTLCEALVKRFESSGKTASRFALADSLKEDLREFCLSNYNFDLLNCTDQQKEEVRPIMVAHGKIMRDRTKAGYWTRKLEKKINRTDFDFAIIPDIRYCEQKRDEVVWLKENKGKLIYIEMLGGVAPNKDEEKNDPILREQADIHIKWEKFKNYDNPEGLIDLVVTDVIKALNSEGKHFLNYTNAI